MKGKEVTAAGQLPLSTAVAMIAVITALMKRHQREAAGIAMNNGMLVWRGERELISQTGLLTAASLKIHQSYNGADLVAHLQVKIAPRTASLIIFMCKPAGTNSRCQGTSPPPFKLLFYPVKHLAHSKIHKDIWRWL